PGSSLTGRAYNIVSSRRRCRSVLPKCPPVTPGSGSQFLLFQLLACCRQQGLPNPLRLRLLGGSTRQLTSMGPEAQDGSPLARSWVSIAPSIGVDDYFLWSAGHQTVPILSTRIGHGKTAVQKQPKFPTPVSGLVFVL